MLVTHTCYVLLQLYREADLHEEKDRISRSLGATRDPNLIQRVLQFAMSVSMWKLYVSLSVQYWMGVFQ